MSLLPYQQRVVEEKAELDSKLLALTSFFSTATFAHLNGDEQRRLQRQAAAMLDYTAVLGERIVVFLTGAADDKPAV